MQRIFSALLFGYQKPERVDLVAAEVYALPPCSEYMINQMIPWERRKTFLRHISSLKKIFHYQDVTLQSEL